MNNLNNPLINLVDTINLWSDLYILLSLFNYFNLMKKALITGITGQDGAYLSNFLLKKGYKVYGAVRRTSSINTARLSDLGVLDKIELVTLDLSEITNIQRVIEKTEPDEIYNLAAQSFVQTSYEQPIYTSDIDGIGVTRILEIIRNMGGKLNFIKPQHLKCLEKFKKFLKMKRRLFIQEAHMVWQSFIRTG